MEQTWRWFGPEDPIQLSHIRQTGAAGIVTSLHHIRYGDVWPVEEIRRRIAEIEADAALGLTWRIVESLQIPEAIKLGDGDLERHFEDYRQSLRNLASCGVKIVCYNFMPVLDWMRTEHGHPLPGGGRALRFNAHEYAAFDCFILKRPGAEDEQPPETLARARRWMDETSPAEKDKLFANIMAGLPGAFERYDLDTLRGILERFRGVTKADLRANLKRFLEAIIPTAEELGVQMCIHPDDPPRTLLGLPRIVCDADDVDFILSAAPSPANGLTLCTGSFGANPANDLPAMARRFAPHIRFAHLRNVRNFPDGSFMEADHLGGDVDMVAVVSALLDEQKRRKGAGDPHWRIPFRPDHGHELLDDIGKPTHPGYPAIGRMKGLAEMRGVISAVSQLKGLPA